MTDESEDQDSYGPQKSAKPKPMAPKAGLTAWVVTDGKAGMENQCIGLAEALGITPVIKRIALKFPYAQLVPWLRVGLENAFDTTRGDAIGAPWPDLLIASGRASTAASLLARQASGGKTFTVQIQDPGCNPRHFDMVVVPRHDSLRGPNVIYTTGALHRVTRARIEAEAAVWAPQFAALDPPYAAVLLGGNNGVYKLEPHRMAELADELRVLAIRYGLSLLITPSRRTGPENVKILTETLAQVPAAIWDGTGPNPYFGMLGLAESVFVTCDSVSMISEAASTGKPVYIIDMEGHSRKFEAFHDTLRKMGITRAFTGELSAWDYPVLNDTQQVAVKLSNILDQRMGEN